MEILELNLNEKNENIIYCSKCDFKCSFMSDWKRHITTRKHLLSDVGTKMELNGTKFAEKNEKNEKPLNKCEYCEKVYGTSSGLWKHKNKGCNKMCETDIINNTIDNNNNQIKCAYDTNDKDQLILMLVKQNAELIKETTDFKSMMMKVIENGTHNTTNTVTNSHNKAFNLNLFLNETCKDAMNINDFVESIKLQVSDLENVGEVGFVEGISNIIVKNLNALDVTKRPIHCTDKKREIIYIKDENSWEKDESQCKMRRMIKKVVSKNQRLIPKFKEQNPEYNKSYSKVSDKYNKLIIESMGGSGDNDLEKENKIIRNITKNIVVDKSA